MIFYVTDKLVIRIKLFENRAPLFSNKKPLRRSGRWKKTTRMRTEK